MLLSNVIARLRDLERAEGDLDVEVDGNDEFTMQITLDKWTGNRVVSIEVIGSVYAANTSDCQARGIKKSRE